MSIAINKGPVTIHHQVESKYCFEKAFFTQNNISACTTNSLIVEDTDNTFYNEISYRLYLKTKQS